MSDAIGPVSLRREQQPLFLGREVQEGPREYGDSTAQRIDKEIQVLIEGIKQDAHNLMRGQQAALERPAERLLDEETLEREQIDVLLPRSTDDDNSP
jgi:cell division protease FtsH